MFFRWSRLSLLPFHGLDCYVVCVLVRRENKNRRRNRKHGHFSNHKKKRRKKEDHAVLTQWIGGIEKQREKRKKNKVVSSCSCFVSLFIKKKKG